LDLLKDPIEYEIIKILAQFPAEIQAAAKNFKPNVIGNYLITLAQLFNKFYNQCPILKETTDLRNARLYLIECLRIVLEKGLALMGIHAPIEM
jgi:arginyl-tRNA synthetase